MFIKLSAKKLNEKLKGLRLKRVVFNPFDDKRGGTTTFPTFIFEDGSIIRFQVQETDAGNNDYGIELTYIDSARNRFQYGKEEAK